MGSTFTLPINKFQVSITASAEALERALSLCSAWVRIHGIPEEARRSDVVELLSRPLGKLAEVDVRSLPGSGAVRLRVLVPEPGKLPGTSCRSTLVVGAGTVGRSFVLSLRRTAHAPRLPWLQVGARLETVGPLPR